MAFFPENDAQTASGANRHMTMTSGNAGSGEQGDGRDLAAAALEAAEHVATLLEPFLQILTAVVQAFTAWQLVRKA